MKFGKDFRFGFSTVGVQHEMGLPGSEFVSDWVVWLHDQENIAAGIVSGDRPEDGPAYWHLYKEDHEKAVSIGMDAAWITIEWARIFPKPTFEVEVPVEKRDGGIVSVNVDREHVERLRRLANLDALKHYRKILEDWRSRGGMVIANLFHWSLPTWLHDPIRVRKLGPDRAPAGWVDERTVVEFAKFAAYVAWKLGDLPDMWSTMNEPNVVYTQGYVNVRSGFPPGYLSIEASMKAAKHLIEAHARAYDVLKRLTGKPVGLIYATAEIEPLKPEDREVAEAAYTQHNFAFIDAVHSGSSPLVGGERKDLARHVDWIGINYYSRLVVEKAKTLTGWRVVPGYGFACEPRGTSRAGRPCSDFGWEIYPEGLYSVLKRFWERYRLPMMVTENGIADAEDRLRPRYVVQHIAQVHKAVSEGIDVRGYLHWALTDNYEWAQGFRMRFGLVYVDYGSKKRFLRPSALVFREIARGKEIPEELSHLTEPPQVR